MLEVAFRVKVSGEGFDEVLTELEDRLRAKGVDLDDPKESDSKLKLKDILDMDDDELPDVPDYFEDLEDE